jgi:hypothetical protein
MLPPRPRRTPDRGRPVDDGHRRTAQLVAVGGATGGRPVSSPSPALEPDPETGARRPAGRRGKGQPRRPGTRVKAGPVSGSSRAVAKFATHCDG